LLRERHNARHRFPAAPPSSAGAHNGQGKSKLGHGAQNNGSVFSITTSGAETVLHDLSSGSGGADPSVGLLDLAGALYGTTKYGGSSECHSGGCATIFELSP
jgi:hypothetical protein